MKSLFAGRGPRRWAVSVAAVAVVGALGAVPVGSGVAHADAYDCGGGAVILVAGTNDPGAGALIGVRQRYTGLGPNGQPDQNSEYKDDPYKVIVAEYPTTLWPLGSVGYNDDVERGKKATEEAIAEYREHCEDEEIVVAGYSQGARVAGDVLSDIANGRSEISEENIRGELYSDPRRDGPESARGIELGLIGVIPGLTMTGPRKGGFGDIPVTSYCQQGDPICDLPDPLHDPFGTIDGLVGYFTKHGYYPTRMYKPVEQWECTEGVTGTDVTGIYTDCVVKAPSAISGVRQDLVNKVRDTLGLAPRQVADLWGYLPNINGIFPHANLSDLQKYISPVMDLLPQLPKLGYDGYLPDLLMLTDLLEGIVRFDFDKIGAGLKGFAGSAFSIIAMPVNFTRYWVHQALDMARPATMAGGIDDSSAPSQDQQRSLLTSVDGDASTGDSKAQLFSIRQESRGTRHTDTVRKEEVDTVRKENERALTTTRSQPPTTSAVPKTSTIEPAPTTGTVPTSTQPETKPTVQAQTERPGPTQRETTTDIGRLSELPAVS